MPNHTDVTLPVQVPLIRPDEKENPAPAGDDVTRRVPVPPLRPDELSEEAHGDDTHPTDTADPANAPRSEEEVTRPIALSDDAEPPSRW